MESIPYGMTYAALGAAVVSIAGVWLWNKVKRDNASNDAAALLDTRLPMILQGVSAGWEKLNNKLEQMVDKAETRADKATEDREQIMKQFLEYTTTREDIHNSQLERMRSEKLDSDKRIHEKLEQCLQRDSVNLTRFQETLRRIDQLESRQYTAALVTPVAAVAPTAPVAPTSFTVPAGGLNITPAG